jgi:hypothetical protein
MEWMEEGRRKRDDGRSKMEEGRSKMEDVTQNSQISQNFEGWVSDICHTELIALSAGVE